MRPTVTRKLRLLVALVTLAALAGLPLQAFAAKGSTLAAEGITLTPLAGSGGLIGFEARLHNSGKANISNLRFAGSTMGGATFNDASSDPCVAAGSGSDVSCELGALPAGSAVELLLVFTAPAAAGTVTFSGDFLAEAKNGTPGAKQDIWPVPDQSVRVLSSSDPDFFSALLLNGSPFQTPTVGTTQTAQLRDIPGQGKAYGVSVLQHDGAVSCAALNYFGKTVDVNVANGSSPVTVVITFDSTPGLTPSKARVVHDCDPVPTDCVASPGYCMTATEVGSGPNKRVQVTVYLPHNGSIKGFR